MSAKIKFTSCLSLIVLSLLIAVPVLAACENTLTISVDSVPQASNMYYSSVTANNNALTWNGQSVIFTVDSAWIGTNQYVGPTSRVGQQAYEYLGATFDPAKSYTLYVEVLYFSAVGNINASYSRISQLSGTSIGVTGTYSYTFAGNNVPSTWDLLYIQVSSSTPYDTISVSGQWRITIVEQGCQWPPAAATATPTPTATPTATPYSTPTLTPTPPPTASMVDPEAGDGRARILAVPDGCDGLEVLPTEWGIVFPFEYWSRNVNHSYTTGYTVRWTFRADVNRTFEANVLTNDDLLHLVWSGPTYGEDMYVEFTWPSTYYDNLTELVAHNLSASNSIMIASICIEPVRNYNQCINSDVEFEDPWQWELGAPAYINNGALNLRPGGWAQQQEHLPAGQYRIQLQAQALPSGSSQSFDIYIGSNFYKQVLVPAGDVPTHFWYDFSVFSTADPILTLVMSSSAPADAVVRIQYVCISLLAAATPTPTPQPTPTPIPPPQSCDNAGYDFSLPDLWTLDGAQIVTESGTGDKILLLMNNSGAYQTLNVPQGQYVLTVLANRGVSGGSPAGFAVDFGYTPLGAWVINPIVPIDEVVEFMATAYIDGGTHELWIYSLPGYYGGNIRSVCLSYVGNPNPQPTPTLGPTPTPATTPWPDPTYCLNPDSGLDTNDVWVVLGSGGVSGSQATLYASDQLAGNIEPDPLLDYDVLIRGYCTEIGTANVYWRNQMHTLLCVGGGMPFNYTFYFPAESASFMSSPLVDLLQPEDAQGVMPRDLPSGYAPHLFHSPLGVPEVPTADPLMSPLAVPEYPVLNDRDALMLSMSSIMQIQASSGNTGQIVITSICVQDREWIPPADPPEIDLYHPVCERDWAIQRDYNELLHPAMLVGLGSQVGMPVHAMYGGTVSAAGIDSAYTFGGVTYQGCVTIDHSAALGANLQSVYCSMDVFSVGAGGTVARGQLLGYTRDANYGILGPQGEGLVLVGVYYNSEWVNPTGYFNGFVDCHPYYVVIEEVDRCSADDGSGIIPPRYNMPAPSIWEPASWVPWLARRLYDTLGYPILCALIPIINAILTVIQNVANAVIAVLTAPLLFLYRIGRIFEYLIALFGRVLAALFDLFEDMARLAVCFRSIVTYFMSAMTAARTAERPSLELTSGPLLYAINLALLLVSSTVANAILVPLVGLLIAYSAWRLVPWGIKNIRSAIGAGE